MADSCDSDGANMSYIGDHQDDQEHEKKKQKPKKEEEETLLDIQRQIGEAISSIGPSRIGTVSIGKSPLRRSKSLVLCEMEDGEWRCEETFHEEGVILYVAIKYNNEAGKKEGGGGGNNKCDKEVNELKCLCLNDLVYVLRRRMTLKRIKLLKIQIRNVKMTLMNKLAWKKKPQTQKKY